MLAGITPAPLDPELVEDVIQHNNAERTRHHSDSIKVSYCAGLLYRRAKMTLLNVRHRLNLPLEAPPADLRQGAHDCRQSRRAGYGLVDHRPREQTDRHAAPARIPARLTKGCNPN